MIPIEIELGGRRCWDISWGIIRQNFKPEQKRLGTNSLYLKPKSSEAQSWSVVYIATETGKCQGIYYVMNADDARRFVIDNRTHGVGQRGTHWQYFQTSIFNFIQKGGIAQCRFTHDTCKMNRVLDELGITPLTKSQIETLFGDLGYSYSESIRGLCPGVIYEVDGSPVDINIDRPRDITDAMTKLKKDKRDYKAAIWAGWANLDSNLGVDVLWLPPVTLTYDNKYRK